MDYLDIRKKFCEISGRRDLQNSDYTDNGADFFLNAGQRHLDRMIEGGKIRARSVNPVTAGSIVVPVLGLRAVKEVWYTKTDGTELYQLSKESLNAIRNYYESKLSTNTGDAPYYYAPAQFRPYPDNIASASWSGYQDIEDLLLGDTHYNYHGVVIMPSPTVNCYISIIGLFYSPTLSATLSGATWTQTKSFWTEQHPDTLISAAMYKMETLYHNQGAAADSKNAMTEGVLGLDYDFAEEDIAGEDSEMGG